MGLLMHFKVLVWEHWLLGPKHFPMQLCENAGTWVWLIWEATLQALEILNSKGLLLRRLTFRRVWQVLMYGRLQIVGIWREWPSTAKPHCIWFLSRHVVLKPLLLKKAQKLLAMIKIRSGVRQTLLFRTLLWHLWRTWKFLAHWKPVGQIWQQQLFGKKCSPLVSNSRKLLWAMQTCHM